ncbi:hypothetical protein JCM3774_006451 [Rhodotorula dairenensis]
MTGLAQSALRMPASLLPHSTSSFQQSLRATGQAPQAEPVSRQTGQPQVFRDYDYDPPLVDELTWSSSRVVWSRGGAIYRSFSYEGDGQEVVQALFADFCEEASAHTTGEEPVASTSAVTLDSLAAADTAREPAFGPYRLRNPSAWSDDPLPLPTEPPTSESTPSSTPQRHLVVIFPQAAYVYAAAGGFVPVQFPFRVRCAWALDVGILLERATDVPRRDGGPDRRKSGGAPTLWSLSKLLGEVKPAAVRSRDPDVPLEWEGADGEHELVYDSSQAVVFSSARRDSVPPLIVTFNTDTGDVAVWQYARRQWRADDLDAAYDDDGAAHAPLPTTAAGHLATSVRSPSLKASWSGPVPVPWPGVSSPMSRGPSSLSGTKRKHGVSFADPDLAPPRDQRSIRRASGQGLNGPEGRRPRVSLPRAPMDPEEEMLDALALHSEPHGLASSRGSQLPTSWPYQADRRSSLTRNDLSVTMDRMALSQSGVPLGHANDLAHEATILLGEAGDPLPPTWEILLREIWSTNLGASPRLAPAVQIFDVRGSDCVIAIELAAERELLLLEARLVDNGAVALLPLGRIAAVASAPVRLARAPVEDLLVLKPDGKFALLGARGALYSVAPTFHDLRGLAGTIASDTLRTAIQTQLYNRTSGCPDTAAIARNDTATRRCLEAISQVLPDEAFVRLRDEVDQSDSMQSLEAVLVAFRMAPIQPNPFRDISPPYAEAFRLGDKQLRQVLRAWPRVRGSPQRPSPPPSPPEGLHFEAALLCLHVVAQDLQLRVPDRADGLEIGQLVGRLAAAAGFVEWVDFYRRHHDATDLIIRAKPQALPAEPPSLLIHLTATLTGRRPSAYPDLRQICELFNFAHQDQYGPESQPTRLTRQLIELYRVLSPSTKTNSADRARACVHKMAVEYRWTTDSLQHLMPHVLLPLREAIRSCQLDPPIDWPAAAYELALRPDLARQQGAPFRPKQTLSTGTSAEDVDGMRVLAAVDRGAPGAAPATDETPGRPSRGGGATRFNEDRRLEEVSRMLCFDKHCTVSAGDRTLEQLTPALQQSLLAALAQRTMSLPVGSGMFRYRQTEGGDVDKIKIPSINTAARILPMASPVNLAEKEPRDPTASVLPDRLEWPEFHAGVAAALQHAHGNERLDNSKLSFNRPSNLDARHAGLLFGLGLSGLLDTMSSSQAYDYLKAKHDPTSVGILLGLAVSFLGTGDPTVTSVISIHLPALHPPQSSGLNVSGMTQAAAAVALGLVHLASGHRTFSNVLLSELCGMTVTDVEDGVACREAYALSAGLAFGMIMLGRGRTAAENAAGESDHLRIFRSLILGESNHPLPGTHQAGAGIDINVTSPAATVAVALMYMRSERKDVAALLAIPDTTRGLDYVRPDLLLLRVIAGALVLWSEVVPTKAWIEAQVPSVLPERVGNRPAPISDLDVSRWHVIAGACFAIGLRFAGTASADGHAALIHYLDRLTRASYSKAPTVQGRIRRDALRNCLSVVSLALAMIMAGTGEVNVLRRLRVAHGLYSEGVTYGSHLASHMALGLLFLGGGRYTLGNSDAAIAALLLSLYPAFPATSVENRAHLQAFRHLWVLAVEPRYLEARDIETNESVFLPVRLRLDDEPASSTSTGTGVRAKQLVAPTLIPDLTTIHTIQSDSPRYLPFSLQLAEDPAARRDFMRSGILYVKRRTGHLSYAEDPRGIRSVFTRSKSEAGSTVFDLGETSSLLASSATNLRDFVRAFSGDVEALSVTNSLSSRREQQGNPTEFESFSGSVLLEGLTRDKYDIAGIYHAIYSTAKLLDLGGSADADEIAFVNQPSTALRPDELRFVVDFYHSGNFRALFGKASGSKAAAAHATKGNATLSVREPLVNPAFTVHLSTLLANAGERAVARSIGDGSLDAYLCRDWAVLPRHLGTAVRHLGLPNRATLQVLRDIVKAAKAEQGLDANGVEAVLRQIATRVAEDRGPTTAWTSGGSQAMARAWSRNE